MYTMKETCQKTGLAYETLKFYCNQGLIPNVKRDSRNHRIFDDGDVAWINSLTCLKHCDMGIAEMKEYLALCQLGARTIPQRKKVLADKRRSLEEEQRRIARAIAYIDRKQDFYNEVLSGKKDDSGNLTGAGD